MDSIASAFTSMALIGLLCSLPNVSNLPSPGDNILSCRHSLARDTLIKSPGRPGHFAHSASPLYHQHLTWLALFCCDGGRHANARENRAEPGSQQEGREASATASHNPPARLVRSSRVAGRPGSCLSVSATTEPPLLFFSTAASCSRRAAFS